MSDSAWATKFNSNKRFKKPFKKKIFSNDSDSNSKPSSSKKKFGFKVRDIVREKILNKKFNILCYSFDKYGRLLVDLYLNEKDTLNDWLINNKYAFSYDGGKKQSWTEILSNLEN